MPLIGGGDGASVDLAPLTARVGDVEDAVATVTATADTVQTAVEDLTPRVASVESTLPQLTPKFRGDWSSSELLWSDPLTSLDTRVWTLINSAPTIGSPPGGSGHSSGLHLIAQSNGLVTAQLNLAGISALAGKTIVQAMFWDHGGTIFGNPPYTVKDGASTRYSGTDVAAWNHRTIAVAGRDVLQWQFNSPGAGVYGELWLAGIEIYGAVQPYMLGEFVIYGGKMWKSTVNNNGSTPGADENWTEVPVNFNQTYTTAGRPSAVTAGKGASIYDSTLNLPLYSNGAAWTDAMGTVR